jgi:hypothetical protein
MSLKYVKVKLMSSEKWPKTDPEQKTEFFNASEQELHATSL